MHYIPTLPPFSASKELRGGSPILARAVPAVPVVPAKSGTPDVERHAVPSGIRLVSWNLMRPPIAIESYSVVVEPDLFARTTLEQLRIALAEPRRWVGWTVLQLIERLVQVGVTVTVDTRDSPEPAEREP
jgi:hypothetical protein